jgi:hypothetical protein
LRRNVRDFRSRNERSRRLGFSCSCSSINRRASRTLRSLSP